MILPSKHLRGDRAILSVGAKVLARLDQPHTVSELWEQLRASSDTSSLTFDWFILSLGFLYAISAIENENGLIRAGSKQ